MRIKVVLLLHTMAVLILQALAMGLLGHLYPSYQKEFDFLWAMAAIFAAFYCFAKTQENADGQEKISGKKLLLGFWVWMGAVALLDAVLIIIILAKA